MIESKRRAFAERLVRKELISAPGIFDGVFARIADRMGFDALYMTGYFRAQGEVVKAANIKVE